MHHSIHPSLRQDFNSREKFLRNPQDAKLLVPLIDSTLLKPNATKIDFLNLFSDANQYSFKSVCIPPCYVSLAKEHCKTSLLCTVIGFPNGYNTTQNKVKETEEAVALGADEIDFVQNINFVKSNAWNNLEIEYKKIIKAAKSKMIKLILETSLLTDNEIEKCTWIAAECGIDTIKTSTGFGSRGANENDIKIINATLQNFFHSEILRVGIKASGGIKTFSDALKMIRLGATRIGTSNATQIIV